MITFQREQVLDVADEIEDLLRMHYEEVALHKEAIPLDPDWPRYVSLEEVGQLAVYTARDDGRLVGYSVFFLYQHIHYKQTRIASNDVLFLHPDYRKGTCGIKLIKHSEQQLKSLGVNKVTWHIKFNKDFRPILHRMGYCDEEVIVGKIL